MKPTFYIPPSARIHDNPGRFICEVCARRLPPEEREGALFQTAADLWRHVEGTPGKPGCADRSPEIVREMSPALKAPGLFDENYEGGDLEWKGWIDRHRESDPHGWKRWMRTDEKADGV